MGTAVGTCGMSRDWEFTLSAADQLKVSGKRGELREAAEGSGQRLREL